MFNVFGVAFGDVPAKLRLLMSYWWHALVAVVRGDLAVDEGRHAHVAGLCDSSTDVGADVLALGTLDFAPAAIGRQENVLLRQTLAWLPGTGDVKCSLSILPPGSDTRGSCVAGS
ncbi:MAG: hypothetical protein LBK95_10685 [Bifidobacteriaceae bacterium]|jgi:hypothetical protein|nr:hypothetical protein [Bifidobacteriaceae bacterium]